MRYSDEKIISGIIEGGTKREVIFNYLYEKLRKKVIAKIKQKGGSTDDALDVLQIAIISFWEKVHKGNFTLAKNTNILGLIMSISERRWIDNIRKLHPEKKTGIIENVLKEEEASAYDDELEKNININLEKLLNQISEKCQKIIIYSSLNNWPLDEIAEVLGYTGADSVKSKKYRCMQQLFSLAKKEKNKYLKII